LQGTESPKTGVFPAKGAHCFQIESFSSKSMSTFNRESPFSCEKRPQDSYSCFLQRKTNTGFIFFLFSCENGRQDSFSYLFFVKKLFLCVWLI